MTVRVLVSSLLVFLGYLAPASAMLLMRSQEFSWSDILVYPVVVGVLPVVVGLILAQTIFPDNIQELDAFLESSMVAELNVAEQKAVDKSTKKKKIVHTTRIE